MFTEICVFVGNRESAVELLQRYRRDRRVLLDFILSGSLIKKVVMPPGAVTLDDVDLDQVSIDYVLSCIKKGLFGAKISLCFCWILVMQYEISFLFLILMITILLSLGGMLELSEAIRDYHDHTGLPQMVIIYFCCIMYFALFLVLFCYWFRYLSFA